MIRVNKKLLATSFIMLAYFQQSANAWIATLKVMQNNNGHIIRLAGDIHLNAFIENSDLEKAMALEEKFLKAIEEPLANFLSKNTKDNEYFIVEKIICDLFPSANLLKNSLSQNGIAAVPLITRLNILGHSQISPSTKSVVAHIYECKLQPNIEIIPYDVRSKYTKLCEMSFPNSQNEYTNFYNELILHKKLFKYDIQQQINNKNKYDPIYSDFIIKKGCILIKELKNELNLENFFVYTFANFGYLTFIAQNSYKNITLYLGASHTHNLAQDLEKIGYKCLFQKGIYDEKNLQENIIPHPFSKKSYQNFFATYQANLSN